MDIIISEILSNISVLCFVCLIGISISIAIVLKPLIGALMLSALFPFAIIAINNIGYVYFMSAFRLISLLTFIMFVCVFRIRHMPIDFSKLKWFLVLLLCGSLLASLRSNEFIECDKIQEVQFTTNCNTLIFP